MMTMGPFGCTSAARPLVLHLIVAGPPPECEFRRLWPLVP